MTEKRKKPGKKPEKKVKSTLKLAPGVRGRYYQSLIKKHLEKTPIWKWGEKISPKRK